MHTWLGRGRVARVCLRKKPTPRYGVGGLFPLRLLHDLCAGMSGLSISPG